MAFVVVSPQPVTLSTELPGRTSPYMVAEVRPQVNGIIQSRPFEEGGDVKAGDVLYQIDPARYQAALDQAKAALAVAQANLPALRARVERYQKALAERAVSQQAYDEAVAALEQGEATVEARKAEMERARIELSYTPVTAPISGRIGRSAFTVGALVTAHQSAPLATINQLDPIYVDVTQSTAELIRLKRDVETGELSAGGEAQRKVRLLLEDGTPYPLDGTLQFRDVTVDPTTGSFTLRMVFPNPQHDLLPGMFVRAVVQEGIARQGILVPQQGVSRNPKGEAIALLVNAEGKVEERKLEINRAMGDKWLVASGLSGGERLIVEGMMNVRPGAAVRAVAFGSPPGENRAAGTNGPIAKTN
ncbi:MAG: acriflavin resistance protein [Phycisphaerae bacterium]